MVVSRHVVPSPEDSNVVTEQTDMTYEYEDDDSLAPPEEPMFFASNETQGRVNKAHEPVYTGVAGLTMIPTPGEPDDDLYIERSGHNSDRDAVPADPFVVAPGQQEIFDDRDIAGTIGYDDHERPYGEDRVYEE